MAGVIAQKAQQAANKPKASLQDYIKRMEPEIAKALPSVMTPERFTRIALSAVSGNPQLAACTPSSFLAAMMQAAQLGLEPNTPLGQAYLIPYRNNKRDTTECTFILGYRGMLSLAYRSGQISTIQAHVAYSNDEFDYSFGVDGTLKHKPATGDRGNPTHVYAMYKTKDGGFGYEVMSIDDVRKHAQTFSQSYKNGPWQTNFEEMAKKTVLKQLLKYAPLSSDFFRGVAADGTVRNDIAPDMSEVIGENIEDAEFSVSDVPPQEESTPDAGSV